MSKVEGGKCPRHGLNLSGEKRKTEEILKTRTGTGSAPCRGRRLGREQRAQPQKARKALPVKRGARAEGKAFPLTSLQKSEKVLIIKRISNGGKDKTIGDRAGQKD